MTGDGMVSCRADAQGATGVGCARGCPIHVPGQSAVQGAILGTVGGALAGLVEALLTGGHRPDPDGVFLAVVLFAGLAGLAQCQYVLSVAPNALVGRELDVVAALVLGGASLEGGVGGVLGAALGLALVAATGNGLTLIGVSSYWRQVAIGAVVLMSVLLAALGRRRASAGRAA